MLRNDYNAHILDLCANFLARDLQAARHDYLGRLPRSELGRFMEGWRFPVIELDLSGPEPRNNVTFVYRAESLNAIPTRVNLIANFSAGYEAIPLQRIDDSIYFSHTRPFAFGSCYRYLYEVDGNLVLDPVNPQQEKDLDGRPWSRFFCWYCRKRVALTEIQFAILQRFTQHILPFRTKEANEFLANPGGVMGQPFPSHLEALDEQVGVVNCIDKILACQEWHLLPDYQTCLELVEGVLRRRNRYEEPSMANDAAYEKLYDEMAKNSVPDWNYARYGSPQFFLTTVRRHTIIGAFGHPKYGGNTQTAAWGFLHETFRDGADATCFDYPQFIEQSLGGRFDYLG